MGGNDRRRMFAFACSIHAICAAGQAYAQAASGAGTSITQNVDAQTSVTTQAVAGIATGQAQNADAQSPGPQTLADQPTDIIVTAQKRSERLRDVPMSITAASGEQLKEQGITTPEQFEKLVPGFTFNKTLFGAPVFFIRGVGFSDYSIGNSPTVAIYVDQQPVPYSPMARGVALDLERVEVLKGPQGTLFGQNSTGGAVNFIAAKPTSELEAGFDLTYGRFNEVNAEAFVSGPLASNLLVRLAVREESRGNWQRGYTLPETNGSKDFQNARLTVDWKPADTVTVELTATGWRDRSDAQQQQFVAFAPLVTGSAANPLPFPIQTFPPAPNNARAAAFDPDRDFRQRNHYYQFGARVDAELTDEIDFTSLTSFSRYSQSIPTDFDSTVYNLSFALGTGSIHSFSQEARFSGALADNKIKWMVGGNYEKDRTNEIIFLDPTLTTAARLGPFLLSPSVINNLQKVDTKAVFGSLDVKLTQTLAAQVSARYTWQNRDFAGCYRDTGVGEASNAFSFLSTLLTGQPQQIAPGACLTLSTSGFPLPIVTDTLNENNLSWRGSLNWKPDVNTLLYVNVTKGYKSGSFASIPYVNELEAAPVSQEAVLAYEAGLKTSFADNKIQLSGAGFYYDYRNRQLNGYRVIQPFGPIPALVSIPRSSIKGGEVSLTVLPVTGLTLTANATYVDTKVKSNPDVPTGPFGNVADFRGQRFPLTPKWQGVADAQYRFPLKASLNGYVGTTLTFHSSTSGVLLSGDPSVATSETLLRIPHYALLDLRAGVETSDGVLRLEVFGRNVTNKFYLSGVARNADYVLRFTQLPATYGITLAYRFNG